MYEKELCARLVIYKNHMHI